MRWNVWNVELAQWENLQSFPQRGLAEQFMNEVVIPEKRPGGPFQVRKAPGVLEQHGTKLMQLKPSMIWNVAMTDLEKRAKNQHDGGAPVQYAQYAFHRRHVIKASTANDIIRAAIEEPGLGLASGKKDTRLLYSDVDLLRAALK